MIRLFLSLFVLLLVGCSTPAVTQPAEEGPAISVADAWVRITSMEMGAAYLTIHNSGSEADQLLKVSSDAVQMIHLHQAEEKDGMMSMHPVDAIEVPAGGDAVLKPGSYHMMLMGLTRQIKPGEKVTLHLTFAKAGEVSVEAEVRDE